MVFAITLRSMDAVEVDASAQTVRVGAGCTWDPVLAATTPHGLAAPCGSAPGVGVVGYLLGGGLGPLASAWGFSTDHVRSFDVVTPADGAITVSADSYPDLFWAMRGGKGGFGVVTAVTIDLFTVSEIYGGGIYFAAADVAGVLAAYAEWAPALPESCTTSIALLRLPPVDALPEAIRGRHVAYVRFASLDPVAQAEPQLADMRGVAKSLLDTVDVIPVRAHRDDPRRPRRTDAGRQRRGIAHVPRGRHRRSGPRRRRPRLRSAALISRDPDPRAGNEDASRRCPTPSEAAQPHTYSTSTPHPTHRLTTRPGSTPPAPFSMPRPRGAPR